MKFLIPILALAFSATAAELPKGLVLHFPFDKAGGKNTVPDASGADNHAKRVSGRWFPDGKSGGGSQFWGKKGHLSVPSSPSLDFSQGTVALWFKSDRSHHAGFPLAHRMSGNQGFSLGFSGDSKVKFSRGRIGVSVNGCPPVLSDIYLADGSWHHAAGTFDGERLRLFIDGKPQKQTAIVPAPPAGSGSHTAPPPILIGGSPESIEAGRSFQGVLDEVMVFRRALEPGEIKAMVEAVDPDAGKPRFTEKQIQGRLRQLKLLYEEGLLTKDFYDRKLDECNVPMD